MRFIKQVFALSIVFMLAAVGAVEAFPTVAQIRKERVQLERLRRYTLHKLLVSPGMQTQDGYQKTVDMVVALDLEIVKSVHAELNRDAFARQEELAIAKKIKESMNRQYGIWEQK